MALAVRSSWAHLGLLALTLSRPGNAQPSPNDRGPEAVVDDDSTKPETRERAAALYDDALRLYRAASYGPAAQRFLEADALLPSAEALQNAIASARKANAHLTVVRAAERALAREAEHPALAASARTALAEAEPHLARLRASCLPAPCAIFLDDERMARAEDHVLPGTHRLRALPISGESLDESRAASEAFTARAGELYEVTLTISPLPMGPATALPEPAPRPAPLDAPPRDSQGPQLPPVVFYMGVGATALLGAGTVWSGLDVLDARAALPDRRAPEYDQRRDDVYDRAERTDWLLGATVVAGAATGALAAFWIDFGDDVALRIEPMSTEPSVCLRSRFE